jgi:hypothetical protein
MTMIRKFQIKDNNGTGTYTFFESPDIEFVDPIEYYSKTFIASNFSMMRDLMLLNHPQIPLEIMEKVIYKQVLKDWSAKYEEIEQTKVPEYLVALLMSKSKNEQEKLLRNTSITPEQLIAFIFFAKRDYNYFFSQYTSEFQQTGLDQSKMPKVVEIKDGKVRKVGETTLSDGQLKQAIEHRKTVVSKFLDKESEWHCLFLTFDSLKGKEIWKGGQPHYHYISDKFGIHREKVIKNLKSKKYNLGSLPHIDLLGYIQNK